MKIGLIRPYEIEYNSQDITDLNKAARSLGHSLKDIYVDKLGIELLKGRTLLTQISSTSKAPEKVDVECAFLRHLGTIKDYEQFGSRIWSVRALEQEGIYVMNPIMGWLAASDKLASASILSKAGIPIPQTFSSEDIYISYRALEKMGESVAKPLRGAMGFGVMRVNDPDLGMHVFGSLNNLSKPVYMQKYLEKKGGGDYRVIVIGSEAIGAEFRKGKGWKSNLAQGGSATKARLSREMAEIAVKSTEKLGLDYAGIDIADTKDGPFVLEANPTISWQGFRKATKIDVASLLIRHLVDRARR